MFPCTRIKFAQPTAAKDIFRHTVLVPPRGQPAPATSFNPHAKTYAGGKRKGCSGTGRDGGGKGCWCEVRLPPAPPADLRVDVLRRTSPSLRRSRTAPSSYIPPPRTACSSRPPYLKGGGGVTGARARRATTKVSSRRLSHVVPYGPSRPNRRHARRPSSPGPPRQWRVTSAGGHSPREGKRGASADGLSDNERALATGLTGRGRDSAGSRIATGRGEAEHHRRSSQPTQGEKQVVVCTFDSRSRSVDQSISRPFLRLGPPPGSALLSPAQLSSTPRASEGDSLSSPASLLVPRGTRSNPGCDQYCLDASDPGLRPPRQREGEMDTAA